MNYQPIPNAFCNNYSTHKHQIQEKRNCSAVVVGIKNSIPRSLLNPKDVCFASQPSPKFRNAYNGTTPAYFTPVK